MSCFFDGQRLVPGMFEGLCALIPLLQEESLHIAMDTMEGVVNVSAHIRVPSVSLLEGNLPYAFRSCQRRPCRS